MSGRATLEGGVGQQQSHARPQQQAQPEHRTGNRQILGQRQHADGVAPNEATEGDQPVDIGRVQQQKAGQDFGVELALAEYQQGQQCQIEDQHEDEPHPECQPCGAGFLTGQTAEQVGQRQERPAQQRGGQHEATEGPYQQIDLDILYQQPDGQRGTAETDQDRQRQNQPVADELAEQDLAATDGVGHQQHQDRKSTRLNSSHV